MTVGPGEAAGLPKEPTFEELMAELESITEKLAAGDLGIEAAADLFERAEVLHAQATERLLQVRARVERLASPPAPA
ncbi:MAG TPA: exodeoxyribonuclease VII small subunit [Acidimicrobiales bacterium]|nr:exodeoxyribonuclease VII small subunit [Acidimicrobiales bacterium]